MIDIYLRDFVSLSQLALKSEEEMLLFHKITP